jgi:pheromone alpha factor receptor
MVSLSSVYNIDSYLLSQNITVNTTYGLTQYEFPEFDTYVHGTVTYGVIFGVRLGALTWAIVSQFLYSSSYKSTMFMLTMVSLWITMIQTILFLVYIYSPFRELATTFTYSYASLTVSDLNVSIAASCFEVLSVISILVTLLYQVQSIFKDGNIIIYWVAFIIVVGGGCVPTCMIWLWALVVNVTILVNPDISIYPKNPWVVDATAPSFAATIVLVCFVLNAKLLYAIIRRKQLGLTQFDATQIFFISFAQTMVIPAVFTIIDFTMPSSVPTGFGALTTLLVVISLPMTGIWAKFRVNAPNGYQNRVFPYYGTVNYELRKSPPENPQPSPTFTGTTARAMSARELVESSFQAMNTDSLQDQTLTPRRAKELSYDEFINGNM